MASTFEIYGEVAAEVGTSAGGNFELFLETRFGLRKFTIPRTGDVGAEVGALSEGDRIALEIEREGRSRVVIGVRPAYIRGFPREG